MPNTRETMGEQACLDALIADTLTSFEDDEVTKIGGTNDYGLNDRKALTDVKLDSCTGIASHAAEKCSNLSVLDIKGTGYINDSALAFCRKLKHLILRGPSLTSIYSSGLSSTPIAINYGAVYVPSDLVSTYKADSNWSKYTILPISEYPNNDLPETVSDTWAQIAAASQDGTYASKYDVGDVKSIDIDGTTYYVQLVAKDADVLASDGMSNAHMTWMLFKKTYGTHAMNGNGEWTNSDMRSWLSGTVLPLLPSDVQSAMKKVVKYTDIYISGALTHDKQTYDKLWIPSAREIFGGSSYEQTGPIYSGIFSDANSRKMYNASISEITCWLRSASSGTQYRTIGTSGSASTSSQTTQNGVVFGFCI